MIGPAEKTWMINFRVDDLAADVADPVQMQTVRAAAEARFGAVHGVIHAAGVPGMGMLRAKTRQEAQRVLAPKVEGTRALAAAFAGAPLDFLVLFSSITAALPEVGQVDYVAANSVLAAWARRESRSGAPVFAIGWDAWRESGMAVDTRVPEEIAAWRRQTLAQGLTDAEGVDAFARLLAAGLPEVIVSPLDYAPRRAESRARRTRCRRIVLVSFCSPSGSAPSTAYTDGGRSSGSRSSSRTSSSGCSSTRRGSAAVVSGR